MEEKREVVIRIENLEKQFGGRKVLEGISLDVYKSETLVIVGGSGCGKSTLLRHIIGQLKPDAGKVYLFGKDITKANEDEMDSIKKRFGMLFQSAALFDSLTVEENIALPMREHTKLDDHIIKIMVKMKLNQVGLRGFGHLNTSQLSGGMKKRVGLARAIALDPEIIFYDEPSAGLDPVVTAVVDKLILDLSSALSITSVVVTHDMNSVFRIADRIVMLYKGKILQIGTKEEIKNSKNEYIQQFINGTIEGPMQFFAPDEGYLEELTK
ncbi:MAG: ABC transporter ATP-binding protein [Candidatus Omnitrophica bacterium]|jgi:phospholipid/cholesterol/gamma-HCH transport system ATP-binding protein|nr:ABC transporter ATP-binding protein [Candidatus Omnitrophota bacterium]